MHDLENRQLSFNRERFDAAEIKETTHEAVNNVVTFVDASAQARRRMAIERVKIAGIFFIDQMQA